MTHCAAVTAASRGIPSTRYEQVGGLFVRIAYELSPEPPEIDYANAPGAVRLTLAEKLAMLESTEDGGR